MHYAEYKFEVFELMETKLNIFYILLLDHIRV